MDATGEAGPLAWAAAWRPCDGESVCGDAYLVAATPGGAMVAVVDGLGHGPDAAGAAGLAVETLSRHAADPLDVLASRCHAALARTRGAALTVASFSSLDSAMTWFGVGNVDGVFLGAKGKRETVFLRGGIVGHNLPPPRVATHSAALGDVLLMCTDGIRAGFAEGVDRSEPLPELADRILRLHSRTEDDALVLAVRYRGTPS